MLRGAERVWPPRNEAQPNREGVASGSATSFFVFFKELADLENYFVISFLFSVISSKLLIASASVCFILLNSSPISPATFLPSFTNKLTLSAVFDTFLYFKIPTTVPTTAAASKQESKTMIAVIVSYQQMVRALVLYHVIRLYVVDYL